MMRYLEYAYLLGGVGIAIFMALNFKDLELGSRITLSFAAMLCAFMYSFRKKQREMMEDMDAKKEDEKAEESDAMDPNGN
jgi:hypothetical protein